MLQMQVAWSANKNPPRDPIFVIAKMISVRKFRATLNFQRTLLKVKVALCHLPGFASSYIMAC